MQVVHEQVGLDNKKSKPLKVVDDGQQEKLEPFRLENEVKSPSEKIPINSLPTKKKRSHRKKKLNLKK